MNTIMICGVKVMPSAKDQPAVSFGKTDKGTTATFRVAEEVYDPAYESKRRLNNYFIEARGDMAERVNKMKLKSGSRVNLTCRMDFSLSVLEGNRQCKMSKDDPEYGAMRYVRGLKMELLDIGYASYVVDSFHADRSNGNAESKGVESSKENAKVEIEPTVKVKTINLDEFNILTRKSRRVFHDED